MLCNLRNFCIAFLFFRLPGISHKFCNVSLWATAFCGSSLFDGFFCLLSAKLESLNRFLQIICPLEQFIGGHGGFFRSSGIGLNDI